MRKKNLMFYYYKIFEILAKKEPPWRFNEHGILEELKKVIRKEDLKEERKFFLSDIEVLAKEGFLLKEVANQGGKKENWYRLGPKGFETLANKRQREVMNNLTYILFLLTTVLVIIGIFQIYDVQPGQDLLILLWMVVGLMIIYGGSVFVKNMK